MKTALAILRKDFLVLWPMALLAFVLIAAREFASDSPAELLAVFVPILAYFTAAFLAIAVAQQDAPASLRHDWLTRPIARGDILLAKAIFLLAATIVPLVGGEFVHGVTSGFPVGEALAHAARLDLYILVLVVGGFAIGAVTTTFVEAIGAAVVAVIGMVMLVSVVALFGPGEFTFFSGSGWVVSTSLVVLLAATAVVVIWLQYNRRNTMAARATLVVATSTIVLVAFMAPWPVVFGLQKALSADADAAATFVLRMPPDCFRSAIVETGRGGDGPQYTNPAYNADTVLTAWDEDQRAEVGPRAITFASAVRAEGVPAGWRTFVGHARATFVDERGTEILTMRPGRETAIWSKAGDGVPLAIHGWLMPRADWDRVAERNARVRLDYSLTLMQPHLMIEVPTDGTRRHYPGFGYCGITTDERARRHVLSCFATDSQPAQVVMHDGLAADGRVLGGTDYRPRILRRLADGEYAMTLPIEVKSVRLELFRAAAHFDRSVETTGVLGGPAAACPTPEG